MGFLSLRGGRLLRLFLILALIYLVIEWIKHKRHLVPSPPTPAVESIMYPSIEFSKYKYNVIVDELDKLIFCRLPKNAITQFKGLFKKRMGSRLENGMNPCGPSVDRIECELSKTKPPSTLADYQPWAVARDPLYRFLSGWLDKCVSIAEGQIKRYGYMRSSRLCYDCGPHDIGCFIHRNLANVRRISGKSYLGHFNVTSSFNGGIMDYHWYPQYWFCGFYKYFADYKHFIYYSKNEVFKTRVRKLLILNQFPEHLVMSGFKGHPFLADYTRHATSDTSKSDAINMLKQNPRAVEEFFVTYLIDYVVLRLKPPDWFRDTCTACGTSCEHFLVCHSKEILAHANRIIDGN